MTALLLGWSAFAVRAESTNRETPHGAQSPTPECLAARDAWRVAESYAATIPAGDVMVGSGDSMMPLYPDRTVIVVQRMPMADLRPGMTVVFIGDRGRPVAHILVARTARGWTAKGLANDYLDHALVRTDNYIGTVVRAFRPVLDGPATTLVAAALAGASPGVAAGVAAAGALQ